MNLLIFLALLCYVTTMVLKATLITVSVVTRGTTPPPTVPLGTWGTWGLVGGDWLSGVTYLEYLGNR